MKVRVVIIIGCGRDRCTIFHQSGVVCRDTERAGALNLICRCAQLRAIWCRMHALLARDSVCGHYLATRSAPTGQGGHREKCVKVLSPTTLPHVCLARSPKS